jgi:hypothetical protein
VAGTRQRHTSARACPHMSVSPCNADVHPHDHHGLHRHCPVGMHLMPTTNPFGVDSERNSTMTPTMRRQIRTRGLYFDR